MRNRKKLPRAFHKLKSLPLDISGATAIEYALIAGMIFLAIVSSLYLYAGSLGNLYNNLSNNVSFAL